MRKILKWGAIALGALLSVGLIAGLLLDEPAPEGKAGPEADRLARKMLAAIGKEAWDSTRYVSWAFPGGHRYVWDKFRQEVQVEWGDKKVLLHTDTQTGRAWKGREEQQGAAAEELLKKAWSFFCNDSFWLNAPAKAFDPGTTRSLVETEGAEPALLVRYASGGVTPGDAYLWQLDENGVPLSWKMWISIIPIGGLEISWEGWTSLKTGARISTRHQAGPFTVEVEGVSGGNSLQDIGLSQNPFRLLD